MQLSGSQRLCKGQREPFNVHRPGATMGTNRQAQQPNHTSRCTRSCTSLALLLLLLPSTHQVSR